MNLLNTPIPLVLFEERMAIEKARLISAPVPAIRRTVYSQARMSDIHMAVTDRSPIYDLENKQNGQSGPMPRGTYRGAPFYRRAPASISPLCLHRSILGGCSIVLWELTRNSYARSKCLLCACRTKRNVRPRAAQSLRDLYDRGYFLNVSSNGSSLRKTMG
jgi:hypothetical protein